VPLRLDLRGVVALQGDVEGVHAGVVALGGLHVIGHDVEAVQRLGPAERDAIGLFRALRVVDVGIGGQRQVAAKHGLAS
jgi:hypothetical protein